jgi:phosphoketolase
MVHRLTNPTAGPIASYVHGYKEGHDHHGLRHAGWNELDRFHLVLKALALPDLGSAAAYPRSDVPRQARPAQAYIDLRGQDMPKDHATGGEGQAAALVQLHRSHHS